MTPEPQEKRCETFHFIQRKCDKCASNYNCIDEICGNCLRKARELAVHEAVHEAVHGASGEQIRQAAINGVLDDIAQWIQKHSWESELHTIEGGLFKNAKIGVISKRPILQFIADLRQQTGQTSAEQQRGREE